MRRRLQQRRENERDYTEMLILQNAEAISGILWSKFLSVDVIGEVNVHSSPYDNEFVNETIYNS